jgi:hypothetical protein
LSLLEISALILLLDKKGLLNKAEVLAEIKSLQRQLAERTGELPAPAGTPFAQPCPNLVLFLPDFPFMDGQRQSVSAVRVFQSLPALS